MNLLPLGVWSGVDVPDDAPQYLKDLTNQMDLDRSIMMQNVARLNAPAATPDVKDTPVGHGLAENLLTHEPMTLLASSYKDGLILADGADRGKVNISFRYLGVGPVVVGNGSTVTYTADLAVAGANGRDTGNEAADTWYYVYIIVGDNGTQITDNTANNFQPINKRKAAAVASLLSISATPKLPPGYNRYRRVGMVRNNNNSDLYRAYYYADGWQFWNEDLSDNTAGVTNNDFRVANANPTVNTWTATSCAKVMPPTSTLVEIHGYSSAGTTQSCGLFLRPTGSNYNATPAVSALAFESGIASRDASGYVRIPTNTSQSIDYAIPGSGDTAQVFVAGYFDAV